MSGQCGPLAMAKPIRLGIAADTLLERALDVLHAELKSFVEVVTVCRDAGIARALPDLGTLQDDDLEAHSDLVWMIIDIEDHLGMPESFSTASSPRWMREVIRRGRALREQAS